MISTKIIQKDLGKWLAETVGVHFTLQPMAPGAGLRRYSRVLSSRGVFVVMETPVDEKLTDFIRLATTLQTLGVQVPQIHAADLEYGFILLSDLGEDVYSRILTPTNADELYHQAFLSLLNIQRFPEQQLKAFDFHHYREKMQWFIEFFLRGYLNFPLTAQQQQDCEWLFDRLIQSADSQPKAGVHYDYHSGNLIRLANGATGVLDFQDAVYGPVTYDLTSLLRDCYIDWPEARVEAWLEKYRQFAVNAGILSEQDSKQWRRWCDFISVQHHIKCVGLFARFYMQKYSVDYITYIPRSLNYLRNISVCYPEMQALYDILEKLRL